MKFFHMKHVLQFILFFVLALVSFISCKKTEPFVEEKVSTLRGVFGTVVVYSEFGERISDFSDVQVTARCVDTLSVDSLGVATDVFDTTLVVLTNELGEWSFEDCPRGFYSVTCAKDGFGTYSVNRYWYDTVRADTLPKLILAQTPPADVVFDSIRYSNGLLYLSRTISYTSNHSEDYPVSTWFFFDTTAQVSVSNHMYAYLSGASYGNQTKSHSYTVQMAIDNLRLYGFAEGDSVYVRIGLDNFKFSSYQDIDEHWVFPNVTKESSVVRFYLDSFYDE